jgi:hypothetical protein
MRDINKQCFLSTTTTTTTRNHPSTGQADTDDTSYGKNDAATPHIA